MRLSHKLRRASLLCAAVPVALLTLAGCTDDGDTDTADATSTSTSTTVGTITAPDLPPLELEPVVELAWPTALAPRPGDPDGVYVTQQDGRVWRIDLSGAEPELADDPMLDLRDEVRINTPGGEPGLVGLTFSPEGDRLYVNFSAFLGEDEGWDRKLVEYAVADDGTVDLDSRRDLIVYPKSQPNHQGGDLAFGPDGYLYSSFGDDKRRASGQDPTDFYGSLVRIDPSSTTGDLPYGIPEDNPFASGEDGAAEVWIYGVRNPWRFSFDVETGDLWIADVGDADFEEIDWLPASTGGGRGANLGWALLEGDSPHDDGTVPDDVVAPIATFTHTDGACSIIGGRAYRGEAIPALQGAFLFADYCARDPRAIWAGGDPADPGFAIESLGLDLQNAPTAFGVDLEGEPYVLTTEAIFKITPSQ